MCFKEVPASLSPYLTVTRMTRWVVIDVLKKRISRELWWWEDFGTVSHLLQWLECEIEVRYIDFLSLSTVFPLFPIDFVLKSNSLMWREEGNRLPYWETGEEKLKRRPYFLIHSLFGRFWFYQPFARTGKDCKRLSILAAHIVVTLKWWRRKGEIPFLLFFINIPHHHQRSRWLLMIEWDQMSMSISVWGVRLSVSLFFVFDSHSVIGRFSHSIALTKFRKECRAFETSSFFSPRLLMFQGWY